MQNPVWSRNRGEGNGRSHDNRRDECGKHSRVLRCDETLTKPRFLPTEPSDQGPRGIQTAGNSNSKVWDFNGSRNDLDWGELQTTQWGHHIPSNRGLSPALCRERESRYMQVLGRAYPAALVHVWSLVYSANPEALVVLSSCRTLMANHRIDKYGRLITTGPSWPCMDTTMHMHNAIYSCQIPLHVNSPSGGHPA